MPTKPTWLDCHDILQNRHNTTEQGTQRSNMWHNKTHQQVKTEHSSTRYGAQTDTTQHRAPKDKNKENGSLSVLKNESQDIHNEQLSDLSCKYLV